MFFAGGCHTMMCVPMGVCKASNLPAYRIMHTYPGAFVQRERCASQLAHTVGCRASEVAAFSYSCLLCVGDFAPQSHLSKERHSRFWVATEPYNLQTNRLPRSGFRVEPYAFQAECSHQLGDANRLLLDSSPSPFWTTCPLGLLIVPRLVPSFLVRTR